MGSILEIKKYPAKVLRKACVAVEKITEEQMRLFEDMLATMRQFSGIGLAAPQVGISKRMIVADIGDGPVKLANPQVLKAQGKEVMEEGCLSVPGAQVKVTRPNEIMIQGLNEKGRPVELKAKGLMARVLLHEIDHLNGRLIVDYMGFLRRLKHRFNHRDREYRES